MNQICLVIPVMPGKSDDARDFMRELEQERKADYDQSERRIGITKEVPGGWRRGVPAKLGRRGGCGWSRAGVAGDRCAARAPGPAP